MKLVVAPDQRNEACRNIVHRHFRESARTPQDSTTWRNGLHQSQGFVRQTVCSFISAFSRELLLDLHRR